MAEDAVEAGDETGLSTAEREDLVRIVWGLGASRSDQPRLGTFADSPLSVPTNPF